MWFERFSELIDRSSIGAAVELRKRILEETDPQHIYVEKVRQFFGVSTSIAKALCELAVREGSFVRCEAVLCPEQEQIIKEACGDEEFPASVHCDVCEDLGLDSDYPLAQCKRMTFYRVATSNNLIASTDDRQRESESLRASS
jgi:hypothetical protein